MRVAAAAIRPARAAARTGRAAGATLPAARVRPLRPHERRELAPRAHRGEAAVATKWSTWWSSVHSFAEPSN